MSGKQLRSRAPHHLSLPFVAESVGVARHALEDWLDGSAPSGEFTDDCRLVVSELVGNSVRHANPLNGNTMDVEWAFATDGPTAGFAIAVSDGGASTTPHRVEAAASDIAGRGLAIVEALASRWWIDSTPTRTTVHALLQPV